MFVDPRTAKVTITHLDAQAARKGLPFWADHQEILYQVKLAGLGLTPDDVLGDAVNFDLAPLFSPLLEDFLATGKILGTQVVDPDKVFVTVRGNRDLRPVAEHCMTVGLPGRLRDIRASFASAFNDKNPRPFDVYAEGLNECIRANAEMFRIDRPPGDLKVWTALENPEERDDNTESVPPPGATAALEAPVAESAPSEEILRALAQNPLLLPRRNEVLLDTRTVEQVVQGVPVTAQIYTFLSFKVAGDRLKILARAIGDLSDFQNKIGPLIDTIPLPTDNCSHFGLDNVVARIWGKQITIDGSEATLKLSGDVEIWTCVKNPVPCTRIVWEERNVLGAIIRIPRTEFFDCNPPIKNRNLTQPFDATLPFRLRVVDSGSFAVQLGEPTINLGGALGGVTQGILNIAGVDVNAKVKEALEAAVHPDVLKQNLPDFLLKYNPTLTRAELLSNSGALAVTLEVEALLDVQQLGELVRDLRNRG